MEDTRHHAVRPSGGTARESHEHLADEGLTDAIARHDQGALAEAYAQHGSRVHALARGLCGDSRAHGVTEAVFLQLWNDPPRFSGERNALRSYLLTQVHRRAVQILRSDDDRAGRASVQEPDAASEHRGTEAIALSLLERPDIDELVSALPPDERHPIVLAYFGGQTYGDVARLLGVSEQIIKRRIRSGLKRIRADGATGRHLS